MKLTRTVAVAIFYGLLLTGAQMAQAERTLSADEVKALFSGKTFDGYNENKGQSYQVYSNPDGTMVHKNAKHSKTLEWKVTDDGQHCAIFNKPKCGNIVDMGDGVYQKVKNGTHSHTMKNFIEGNQIN